MRDEWDSEQARIKEAEAEAKRKRIEAINQRIAAIRDIGNRAMRCATSEQAQAIASELDAVYFEGMDEFEADAQYAHGEATETCATVIERLQSAEQTARDLEQQRRELAAVKAEADAALAELARIRAEERAKAEIFAESEFMKSQAAYGPKTEAANTPATTAQATGPMLKLGEINARLSPISISSDGLAQLGFTPDQAVKTAKLYRAADLPLILAAMARHLKGVGVDLLQSA